MTGQYQHNMDVKGRLSIPAKLREELGSVFYVTIGIDPCLTVHSDASWQKFLTKYNEMPYSKARAMRVLMANAAKCEPDGQGRILLPQKLRQYAKLQKEVVIIGMGDRAEIWDAAAWNEMETALDPADLAAAMEELGF